MKDFPPGMSKANYIEAGLHQIVVETKNSSENGKFYLKGKILLEMQNTNGNGIVMM